MDLPKLSNVDVVGKRVIVRMDLDVDEDYTRLEFAEETLDYLVSKNTRLILIGHKGRPEGEKIPELSLAPIADVLGGIVGEKVNFFHDIVGYEVQKRAKMLGEGEILLLENLRFEKDEEENNEVFSKDLASLAEIYVNEAFAVSHRPHATIVDKILVGGRLPLLFGEENPDPDKIMMGQLIPDKEDITLNTIDKFKREITKAGTIVVAGVQGKYEDKGHRQGRLEVFNAIAASSAFKVAGGGDAEAAITEFVLNERFDWISVGGGAMLEYLAK